MLSLFSFFNVPFHRFVSIGFANLVDLRSSTQKCTRELYVCTIMFYLVEINIIALIVVRKI